MTVGISELPPEGMQLAGVALSGDPDRGTRTTEGLSLLFTTAGITVQGPQPQIERLLVWSGLDTARCGEKIELPDGRDAAVMELTSGGQSIRFLLPTENVTPGQAAYLDQALPAWLARYKPTGAAPSGAPSHDSVVPIAGTASTGGQGEGEPAPGVSPAAGNGSVRGTVAASPGAASAATRTSSSGPSTPPAPPSPWSATAPPPAPPTVAPVAGVTSLIPPPPGAPGGVAAGPPPPPPPPSGPEVATTPPPDTAAPVKKGRGWRRSRSAPVSPVPPPDALAPTDPPTQPPKHPVPLKLTTLPPPANGAVGTAKGPVLWNPKVDPVTGEAQWDGPMGGPAPSSTDTPAPSEERRRGLRRWAKGGVAPTTAAAAAAGTVAASGRIDDLPAPPSAAPVDPAVDAGLTGSTLPDGANGAVAPVPLVDGAVPPTPPTTPAPSPAPTASTPDATRAMQRKRITLAVLVVLLLAVVGGIAYVATNKNSTPKTAVPPVAPSSHAVAADTALAASINLRLDDLPATWTNGTAAGQRTRPPVAPANAQVQADQALASCLGVSYPTVAGLFGGAALPGQTGSATSPTFQSGTDPDIQMYTTTTVLRTAAQAQTLAAPFAEPSFVTCFGQYQSSLVSAAVPGSTAQIEVVTLAAPAGVKAYGYVTTLTIPAEGNEVIGEGFMIGGRVESKIEPTTNGPTIPSDAFNSAFNAVVGRVAQAGNR